MRKNKVSIIVPVYNVEQYLDKCIKSIVNQTLKEIEIILINDGSTDNAASILENWAKKDDRIIVIHQKNAGLAAARNSGLKIASGKYIGFVDSDDYIEPTMYEKLYQAIDKSYAEIVQCNQNIVADENYNNIAHLQRMEELCSTEEGLFDINNRILGNSVVWNKLYRKSFLDRYDIKFVAGIRGTEDDIFHWAVITLAKNIYFLPEKLYNYVQRTGSIMDTMNTKSNEYPFENFFALEQIYYHLIKYGLVHVYKGSYLCAFNHFYNYMFERLTDDQKTIAEGYKSSFMARYDLTSGKGRYALFSKEKDGNRRKITILGFIKFSYKKDKKKMKITHFSYRNSILPLFEHPHNVGKLTERMTERSLELAIANKWLNEIDTIDNIIELGAVTPYYWEGRIKEIVDPTDNHNSVNHKCSLFDMDLKNKNILSISTIEHIGTGDYNLDKDEDCISALNKIVKESNTCLITFPVGYNKILDEYFAKKQYENISIKPNELLDVFLYERNNYDNNFKSVEIENILNVNYGPVWANGVVIIEKAKK